MCCLVFKMDQKRQILDLLTSFFTEAGQRTVALQEVLDWLKASEITVCKISIIFFWYSYFYLGQTFSWADLPIRIYSISKASNIFKQAWFLTTEVKIPVFQKCQYRKFPRTTRGLYANQTQLSFDTKYAYIGCGLYEGFYHYRTVLK